MTKEELVGWMAKEAGITKSAAAKALNAFMRAIHDSLKKKGGKIRIADLGTFVVVHGKPVLVSIPRPRRRLRFQRVMCLASEHPSRSSRHWGSPSDALGMNKYVVIHRRTRAGDVRFVLGSRCNLVWIATNRQATKL